MRATNRASASLRSTLAIPASLKADSSLVICNATFIIPLHMRRTAAMATHPIRKSVLLPTLILSLDPQHTRWIPRACDLGQRRAGRRVELDDLALLSAD